MGLDMYLYAAKPLTKKDIERLELIAVLERGEAEEAETEIMRSAYLSAFSFYPEPDQARCRRVAKFVGVSLAEGAPSIQLEELCDGGYRARVCVAYWRKANAIHAWLVDHVQAGVDECQVSPAFGREKLVQLQDVCSAALRAYQQGDVEGARRLCAPQSGFFFGSSDVDESWAEVMHDTVRMLDKVLAEAADAGIQTFHYRSSW